MNTITIVGRLEQEPVRREVNGSVVCTFRITSGRTGVRGGRVSIDVEAWGALAGLCYRHLTEGRSVIVSGRLIQREWSDVQSAQRRWRHLVHASSVEFLPGRTPSPISPVSAS